jgi:hypothetical protein
MQHSFNVEIAKKYGILEAVLLNHLWFWIKKNKANNTNYFDGNYWTYNSKKAFSELFPYASERQIDYALKKLIDCGLVITGNYNKSSYDRTLWYAITKVGYSILQNCEMETTKLLNGNDEIVQPIPDINTDINTDNNNKKERKKTSYDEILNSMVEDDDVKNTICDYIKMRKLIKKPMTDRAVTMLINKLFKLSNSKQIQIKILEQSILKNWTDIYPYKEENNYAGYQGNVKTDLSKYDR